MTRDEVWQQAYVQASTTLYLNASLAGCTGDSFDIDVIAARVADNVVSAAHYAERLDSQEEIDDRIAAAAERFDKELNR